MIILRNRLKYALTYREAMLITHDKASKIKIDGRTRTDVKFPVGFGDVLSIDQTSEYFRLLYDSKGRFSLVRISVEDSKFKLCKVKKRLIGANNVPYIVTHDGRTIRYPHPHISPSDTIKLNLETGEIDDFVKFEQGNVAMITGGRNTGRVGLLTHTEKHEGGFDIAHLRDTKGNTFATRLMNAFVIGKGKGPWVTLPKQKGIKKTILEEHPELQNA